MDPRSLSHILIPIDSMSLTAFSFPTRTVYGAGALNELPSALAKLGVRRPLVVTDGGLVKTDAFKQVEDPTGSGPFKMVKAEWVPGNKVVYVKNTDYVPRKEAPSWGAGGKVAKVEIGRAHV